MTTDRFRVEDMDLADLLGQTMVLPIYGASTATVTTEQAEANRSIYGAATPREVIERLRPGGVLLLDRIPFHPQFGKMPLGNVGSAAQLAEYTEELQAAAATAGLPRMMIVADHEGGRVNRLPVPPLPPADMIGATGDNDLARRAGELTGLMATSFGVDVVEGPVAAVGFKNPVIGDRAFGSDSDLVSDMVAATVEGIRASGAASVVKHWPGLGRAEGDGHKSPPVLNVDLADWHNVELRPFRAAVRDGVDAVLVTHVTFPAADPTGRPASISAPIVERIRTDAEFDGVVFSDSLWMPGIRQSSASDAEIGMNVLRAGVDVLLAPPDPRGVIELVTSSPARDELQPMLEQAFARTLALRQRMPNVVSPLRGHDWSDDVDHMNQTIKSETGQ
jgi:beta-N-acetylhexosaminidase